MKYYFQLQFTMLNRQLRGFGVHPLVGYLLDITLFSVVSLLLFQRLSAAPVIYTGIAVFLIAGLSNKSRNRFLRSCFLSVRYRQLRLIENTLVAIPFFLFLIIKASFGYAIMLLASGVILSFVRVGSTQLFILPTPFYKHPFEYPAGFRKNGWLVLLCFILTIIAIAVDNFNLGAFALVIVFLVTCSFYNAVEEDFFVWTFSKRFGQHQVLEGIDAVFLKGQVYGIIGENGSGKTTFFNCLAGLETCNGTIASEHPILKDHTGFLTTNPYFFPKITGSEYIRLLCNARSVDAGNYEAKNIFDLPLQEYAAHYSTGMKKKLAFLAILLQENDLFILDEPFNGVDIHSNILITAIIHQLKALNKTVLISSHIFSTLQDTCDEIFLLQNGRFSRKVAKADFPALEAEMKDFSIGNLVDKLRLK